MDGRGFKNFKNSIDLSVTYKITDYNGEEFKVRFMNQKFKNRSKTYLE